MTFVYIGAACIACAALFFTCWTIQEDAKE